MEWTLTNLVVQIVAGFLGAHGAASAAHEHKFGFLDHSLAGVVCGALSGYFLQIQIILITVVPQWRRVGPGAPCSLPCRPVGARSRQGLQPPGSRPHPFSFE